MLPAAAAAVHRVAEAEPSVGVGEAAALLQQRAAVLRDLLLVLDEAKGVAGASDQP